MYRPNGISFVTLALLLLNAVSAAKADGPLRQRQTIPLGTGASASTTAASSTVVSSSVPPTAATSTTPASVLTTSSLSPSSTPVSSAPPTSTTGTEIISSSISPAAPSSQTPSSSLPAANSVSSTESDPPVSSSIPPSSTNPVITSVVPVSSRTQQIITTIVTTIPGGVVSAHVLTTSALVAVTSPSSTSTSAPGLVPTKDGSGSSGLQTSQKRIIIGVVVGIGGALILGGLGLVAWRVWGKRHNSGEDDDDLMSSRSGAGHGKSSSMAENSPFRSTLDQYHNPTGQVNTASNF
ncbi:mucin 12, cell surface associated [Varicellaria rhodocarpa]|nr:mucin 12, cell surface associated [Varicellaria rhodocarpa]